MKIQRQKIRMPIHVRHFPSKLCHKLVTKLDERRFLDALNQRGADKA